MPEWTFWRNERRTSNERANYQTSFYNVVKDTHHERKLENANTEPPLTACETCAGSSHPLDCLNFATSSKSYVTWGLWPLTRGATLLGLLHTKSQGRLRSPSFFYSLIICTALWANVARFGVNYTEGKDFGTKLFTKITIHVWYGQVALTCTLFLVHISPKLLIVVRKWDAYARKYQCQTGRIIRTRVVRSLVAISLLVVALAAINCSTFFIEIPSTKYVYDTTAVKFIMSISEEEQNKRPTKVALCAYLLYSTLCFLQWAWALAMVATLCYGLKYNFETISSRMAETFQNMTVFSLEKIRQRHQLLCNIVKHVDGLFSFYNLLSFATAIPLMCFSIYNFAFNADSLAHVLGMSMAIMMIICITAQMGILTLGASALCSQVGVCTE